ncbi:TauD/TfdA family dioxygenase [Streptomyces pini]|uniref:L-asparagine oxygenase n=1 Tax=Streptomyces pini TaxID=1520580 RepID=A0A1I4H0V0_9ACTN|nr:TauD/TfdA family dioxygenase [Streptomyces pini]SFL35884.1 L-asparagine oxygenase [Streptomyces pini]
MNPESRFELSDAERADVALLADELMRTPPGLVDGQEWLDRCRGLSCHLPARLRNRLRAFRHDPGRAGMLLIRNLPEADPVPPTPQESDSVERRATLSASVLCAVAMELGEVVAYRNEKRGALVQNVVPVPGREAQQSNAGSVPLEMHIENAFHPHRPDYVGLLCVRSDHDLAAGLRVACVRAAMEHLDAGTRQTLRRPLFLTEPPPSFDRPDSGTKPHAVLTGDAEDPDIRVDFHATHSTDPWGEQAMDALEDAVRAVSEEIVLAPADLVFVDNRVTLHGRTAFTPRYDGEDRWLQRAFVHLDHRRSRAVRSPHGHVLN